ncbi:MAG: DUF3616 domain-containing protein, partial [Victivallales bacterium]|nr:DUF3616 domain-containing protein [Victivallales bacterium]
MVPAQSSARLWLVALLLVSPILPSSHAADVRTDLDADISRDGVIDNDDPRDNGYVQNNPPGLPVTIGALEKLALRCTPKSVAKGYVRLSVVSGPGAWKALKNPRWQFRARPAKGGHIRVWKDPDKTTLILDSHDLAKQTTVWRLSYNAPMAFVPLALYVEGVVASKEDGDVALALEYGPVATKAKSTRDILVATVQKAPDAIVVGGEADGPEEKVIDIDGDINRDGTVVDGDPTDDGEVEDKPPGLPVAIGALEKLSLRCVPRSRTEGYVRFTVVSGGGEWQNLQDPENLARPRRPAGGHIRVWEDQERTKLILDSHEPGKKMVVWTLSDEFPIERIPTTVYAEGVAASRAAGDVVLVLGYGSVEVPDGPDTLEDILVATVPEAKPAVDLVGDVNRDGTIAAGDPADNGEAEDKPPGLPVTIGAHEKLSLRCVPKSRTEGYVRFTVVSGPGEWKNLQDPESLARPRRPAGGHIRVWEDPERTKLILDSHENPKMTLVWALSNAFPVERIPTTVYAEGVVASRAAGDVILVLDYGPTEETTGPGSLRDVLVTTVAPAEPLADLVGDINRDDAITPADPADNGEAEDKPSGLPVAIGSLEKLSLRCVPKSRTEGFVRFTVMSGAGEWEHLRNPARLPRPRRPGGGRIRVWEDQEKTKLILDSHTLGKMDVVWALSETFPIDRIPTTVYAEGVAVSREAGDVVLVLNYGLTEATTGPGSLQDVLVATVSKATPSRVRVARASDNAEQLAIWIFEHVDRPPPAPPGTPSILLNDPMTPKYEDVVGAPTLTMLHADIEPVDVGGRAYTDVEGRPHGVTLAAGWEDIKKKGGAADAEFIVKIATTGWKDIEVRFDYKSDSADDFELDYSLDDGTQWTAARGPVGLVDGGNWQALPFVDLSSVDAIENLPEVIFRFYDFKDTGNDMFWFDNLEFIGDRVPPGIPTIEVATTTTPYLKLPAQNEGYVSGVIGDPTDPARTLGIDFTIADPNTPLNQLRVAEASLPVRVPADGRVQLLLSGTGAVRNLKITPTKPGYADITVEVSDGVDSDTYVVHYAASAAAPNPAGPRFHTGISDISAATEVDAKTMLVANDEDCLLWLYHRGSSGLHRKAIDTAPWLALTSTRETDIEGCARDGARAYWIGSHGNNSDGKYRDNRCRLFGTTISGTGDQANASPTGYYARLRVDLVNWDNNNLHGKGAKYYGLEASSFSHDNGISGIEPKRDDGFNIEGLAMGENSSTVYVGFRAPLIPPSDRKLALVMPVTNVLGLTNGSPSNGPASFGSPIELDLGGRGVRSISRAKGGGYMIVAGPTTNATGTPPSDFRLYSWSGNPLAAPALLQNDLTGLATGGNFEVIVEPNGGVSDDIQLLNDNGSTKWYGDGAESKTLNANWQKFRSDWVTPGAPVPAAPFSMTMGGTGYDRACSVVHTLGGGSIVVGTTSSTGAGMLDLWVCKLDGSGNVEWQRTYGGAENDCFLDYACPPCVRQTPDGGYIVVTSTASFSAVDGDRDVWVLRLAGDGGIVWQKTYGGQKWDFGNAVAVCSDGSFVVGCTTLSFGPGQRNMWVLKLKADGTILWQSVYSRRR